MRVMTSSTIVSYGYAGIGDANPAAATTINGVTYTWDNSGNLSGFGTTTYSWDYRDRLTQSANGSATSTYGYDQNNQRVWQKTTTSATTTYPNMYVSVTAGATTTDYIYLPQSAGGDLVAYFNTGTTS